MSVYIKVVWERERDVERMRMRACFYGIVRLFLDFSFLVFLLYEKIKYLNCLGYYYFSFCYG